jgi:hypothetical protein|nr:MAG TPA: hypothetical protein [Caudoviricetes sp.]
MKTVDVISKVELRKMKLSLKEPMIATMYSDGYSFGSYSFLYSHYRFKRPTVIVPRANQKPSRNCSVILPKNYTVDDLIIALQAVMINPECVYFVDRKEKTYHFIDLLKAKRLMEKGESTCKS